ncbi:sulfatase-like hydrolase/transferase [Pelagicoccus sp. SDUM812005]|uniref:sulfatase family protein n=1 Tax=Pelagicoccus sp. SDUM812005 TaxID=3041257 RepID=UPI00280D3BE7|nr:sulfatase-like hydrolase/transferase [Pelagicoccus sp. SDUM812005]MDQ8183527.1 sulfatase-like hydrolase/transferase [Pelagicoccus sp. SDUM812005]
MSTRPNFVVIKTDQQRADTIAALGAAHMTTPNMDRLVREGVSFTQSHCCAATCVASRAAFYTGQFAHNTGAYGFDQWAHHRTWLHELKDAGYLTSAIGKVHHMPGDDPMAFHDRVYSENFTEYTSYDDYSNFLLENGQEDPYKLLTQNGDWLSKCNSAPFPLEEKYFVDNFIGTRAVERIEKLDTDQPFYLHVGFVGPHDPYAPPQRFVDLYADREVPEPKVTGREFDEKPPQFRRFMEQCINPATFSNCPGFGVYNVQLSDKSPNELRRMRRHYYGRITAIDEQIGHILAALEKKGALENTIILFTSDHGDNLGDHQMIYKWLMTEQVTNIPLVFRLPNGARAGEVDSKLFSQIDVGPTFLEAAGLESQPRLDGSSAYQRLTTGDASSASDRVYCEDNYLTMMRTEQDKLVHYAGQDYGEYYDLAEDPDESRNLFDSPDHQGRIKELQAELLDWVLSSRYLRSAPNGQARPHWPDYHPEDPYILSGRPRPERTKLP